MLEIMLLICIDYRTITLLKIIQQYGTLCDNGTTMVLFGRMNV